MSLDELSRTSDWTGVRAVVVGIGVSGFAAADNLLHLGASVTILAESANDAQREKAHLLEVLGATLRIGPGESAELPDDVDVVVTSPGVPPTAPLLVAAARRGVPRDAEAGDGDAYAAPVTGAAQGVQVVEVHEPATHSA